MRFRYPPLPALALLGALLLAPAAGRAMSVLAPSFDQLVAASDTIVRGIVTDVHCVTVSTPQGQAIRTLVTLRVERALKGSPGATVTLSLLGGKVGPRTLTVVGMPRFQVGDDEIVFTANNGRAICPLIAASYGRYHVRHDPATNRDYVARNNGAPLASTAQVAQALDAGTAATAPADGMTPEAFEARIAAAVAGRAGAIQP